MAVLLQHRCLQLTYLMISLWPRPTLYLHTLYYNKVLYNNVLGNGQLLPPAYMLERIASLIFNTTDMHLT